MSRRSLNSTSTSAPVLSIARQLKVGRTSVYKCLGGTRLAAEQVAA
jgi:hypothetical protein